VLVYTGILLAITVALFVHLSLRSPLKVDVIRDRGALGREVENGEIENVYRLQFINSAESPQRYRITVSGIDTIRISSEPEVAVERAGTRMVPVRVRVDAGKGNPGTNRIEFRIEAAADSSVSVREASTFYVPR
jgi:polyferredoxin